MKQRIVGVTLLTAALLVTAGTVTADDTPERELRIKAAFLYNIAKFVEWPAGGFGPNDGNLIVGVLSDKDFGDAIAPYDGKRAGGRTIRVQQSAELSALQDANILFIGRSRQDELSSVLGSIPDAGVLTVAEFDGFAVDGGIVRLYVRKNKVRLQINRRTGEEAGLVFRSQLLSVADTIGN